MHMQKLLARAGNELAMVGFGRTDLYRLFEVRY
ncbi:uncharacterized protein METZ01_LOCUS272616 [marine metagenome]|uniref:Uncharacterized protein n=1 Tax=marine metagenome TaxID=408172 RepID=A0A382K8K9_9ZZZZ